MKCLNCQNFVTAHACLTGRYLVTFFTVLHRSYWISASSCSLPTLICASLVGTHRSKLQLEVEDFIFHVVFSRETFQTLAWKFLLCVPQKVFGVYIFPNFVLIVVQKLVKANPRCLNTFCLFLLFACNCSNLSKQEAKHSCYNLSIKGEKYQLDLFKF